MEDKIKLNPGEEIKLEKTEMKGFMDDTDVNYYAVINKNGEKVGTVVHTDRTAVKGFKRTQSVIQKDLDGNVIVNEQW